MLVLGLLRGDRAVALRGVFMLDLADSGGCGLDLV